jgi:hypothetical protein
MGSSFGFEVFVPRRQNGFGHQSRVRERPPHYAFRRTFIFGTAPSKSWLVIPSLPFLKFRFRFGANCSTRLLPFAPCARGNGWETTTFSRWWTLTTVRGFPQCLAQADRFTDSSSIAGLGVFGL